MSTNVKRYMADLAYFKAALRNGQHHKRLLIHILLILPIFLACTTH